MSVILKAENISKQYRLGSVGTGSLQHDLNRWWHSIRGKEDPYLKLGGVNDRSAKATEDYVWALRDINFEVKQGEVLGIIGKNGAGKSTLLKILSRVTAPTTGSIKTKGRIASLLEVGTGFHGELTGRENIFMNGAVLGMNRAEIKNKLDEIIAFSGCEKYIDTPVKRYSSGMTVRLGFAVAAHLEPEILVVDEVLAVGDAEFQKKAIGKMQDLSTGEGRTVIFVSHNMTSVQRLCSRVLLMQNGKNILEGNPHNVVEDYISDTDFKIQKHSEISNSNRQEVTSKEIELIKISDINEKNFIRKDLNFAVQIHVKGALYQDMSFSGSICTTDDTRVGSFFSSFNVDDMGMITININIPDHNLSIGKYYLNISVSKGRLGYGNLRTLDHAYKAIYFEIIQSDLSKGYLLDWKRTWGNIFFESHINLK